MSEHSPASGTLIGQYRVESKLGEGGMGEVWLATDVPLDRTVALKLLPAEVTQDPARVSRFEREARAASALNHPNVCTILGLGQTADGRHYIAMEHVDGATLRARLAASLAIPDALDIAIQVAAALSAAHAAGIVHRDIKPENVMIRPDGLVKVLDFGLAKLVTTGDEGTGTSTETFLGTRVGTVLGTAAYMSPEQAEGKPIDHRSDIFAFGSLLYERTAGEPAFTGESMVATLAAVLHKDPATRNGGHCVYPSADETQIYYTKNDGDSALWTMPVAGGPEHEVLPSVVNRAFVVFGDGVYFIPHADRNRRYAVHHLDLRTGIVTPVLPIAGTANLGLSVSPDRRYVLYAETDVGDSDLMLVEGFR